MSEIERVYREAARKSVPIEVMIELTHHCDLRCRHCYIPDFSAPDGLSTERILRLLDELVEMKTLVVALSGGEMLLRRDWFEIASRARKLAFDLHLFTHAGRIDDQAADQMCALDATVHVSFHSLEESAFDAFTRRPGSYRKVVAGIDRLLARGVRVLIKVPLMTWNLTEAGAIRAWAEARGAACRLSPFITAKKNGDTSPLALRVAHAELVRELGGPVLGCHDGTEVDPQAPLCAAATRYACVDASGALSACNILPGSDVNLREMSFRTAWETSAWLSRIRSLRPRDLPVCSTCSRLSYCGRCTAQALVEDGDLVGPSSHAQSRAELIEAARASG